MHLAPSVLNYIYLGLLLLALSLIEFLRGGADLLFHLPSCALLAATAVLTIASIRRTQIPANLYCLLASALFFAYLLGRILSSPVEYLARHDLYSVLGALIVYLLIALLLATPKQRLWLV